MIIVDKRIKVDKIFTEHCFEREDRTEVLQNSIYFDLEHYIYKVPVCIGVFGSCFYDETTEELVINQYMIEDKKDSKKVIKLSVEYFKKMSEKYGKKYVVTFSGNNDFTVLNHLLNKNKIDYSIKDNFTEIDIQKEYENVTKKCIGLKVLEKEFDINREGSQISGSNLAKTFSKIIKDEGYIKRMPQEKIETILAYNQQDIVSLFNIIANWNNVISKL